VNIRAVTNAAGPSPIGVACAVLRLGIRSRESDPDSRSAVESDNRASRQAENGVGLRPRHRTVTLSSWFRTERLFHSQHTARGLRVSRRSPGLSDVSVTVEHAPVTLVLLLEYGGRFPSLTATWRAEVSPPASTSGGVGERRPSRGLDVTATR